jgi:hypothetical protein
MPLKREPYNPLLKSYPDSERINSVSIGAETLFTRLLAQADDADHYFGDAGMVLGKLYTRRMCAQQVDLGIVQGWIGELLEQKLVDLYEVDGRQYIEIINRRKELRSDLKPDIRFPERPPDDVEKPSGRIRAEFGASTQPNPTQPNPTENTVPAAAGLPPGFVAFWQRWPKHHRKQGRSDCVKLWKSRKLEPMATQILGALNACIVSADWTKNGGEFIPFPKTWLNRTPWETDPAELSARYQGNGDADTSHYRDPPAAEIDAVLNSSSGGLT